MAMVGRSLLLFPPLNTTSSMPLRSIVSLSFRDRILSFLCLRHPARFVSAASIRGPACYASFRSSVLNASLASLSSSRSATSQPLAPCLRRILCSSTDTPSREAELIVAVQIEESFTPNEHVQAVVDQLEIDGPLALKFALDSLEEVEPVKTIELSVVVCDDKFIQELNREWRGENAPTDVLSFPQEQPSGLSPILLLGDVIISVETAARQAEERGHTLLDEMRILLVHGLLHVLGYDHEEGPDASKEMEDQESHILMNLGWKGKGLIRTSFEESIEAAGGMGVFLTAKDSVVHGTGSKVILQRRSPFRALFCDLDGTLLNSRSQITRKTAAALKEAIARGVKIMIATGKSRTAAIAALEEVGLAGENGVVSTSSPGVFLQGLLVYGNGGCMLHKEVLAADICADAFKFSLEQNRPMVGFSEDCVVTLFDDPRIEELHVVYKEPKAELMPSLEYIINNIQLQKLLFIDSTEGIRNILRPHWSEATQGRARVVQAIDYMLEILPVGASKGKGIQLLLDDLKIHPDDVMAIGDGENDIEMLELVGWGVAMANGSPQTLSIADAQVASNDEDGVIEALERFILT